MVMSPKSGLLADLRMLRGCLIAADVKPSSFAVPVVLALGVGVCEALGVALLLIGWWILTDADGAG